MTSTTKHYELTYDLPGANGGHRAEAREFDYPETDTDGDGAMTEEAIAALDAAQTELDQYVASLVSIHHAKNIRISSDDLELNIPQAQL